MTNRNSVTRRHVLGAMGAGAALAATFAAPARAAAGKMKMNLVCGSIGVKADQTEAIALAAKYGFDAVEPQTGYLANLSSGDLKRLLDDMKAKNLVFGNGGLSVDFRHDKGAFLAGMKQLPASSAALERAGVDRVSTWITPTSNDLTFLENLKLHATRLREVASVLGDHGQRLGLEYVGPKTSWTTGRFPFVHSMREMKELIAAIGRTNVGFVLDSWHWYTAGETRDDLLTLTNADVVCGDLNDAPAGIPVDEQRDLSRELPMATGVIDMKGFLTALEEIGFDGPLRAEPFNKALNALPKEEAVAKTAEALKKAFALLG